MHDSRLDELVEKALAVGCRVLSESKRSVTVVRPRGYSKLGVVVLSVVFVLAWLTFGEMGFAVGILPLATYALAYLFRKDKVFEIYLDDEDVPKVRRVQH